MNDMDLLYQDTIMEHAKTPRKKGSLPPPCCHAEGVNPFCGDHVTLYVKKNHDRIEQIRFEGEGCAISTAAASMLCTELEGLTVQEGLDLVQTAHSGILKGDLSGLEESRLMAFSGVHEFPMRVKCATLALHVAKRVLESSVEGDAGFVQS